MAYSLGRSNIEAARVRYPAAFDRRHVVDATVLAPLTAATRVGAAFSAGSGASYTRFTLTRSACDSLDPCTPGAGDDTLQIGLPNAERAPPYVTLDLLAQWRHASSKLDVAVFLQLRNVVGHGRAVTYVGSERQCSRTPSATVRAVPGGVCDLFDRGLPLLPLAGVRVAF